MKSDEIVKVLDTADTGPDPQKERLVRDAFWSKFAAFAARLPFAEDVAAAWYCATDSNTPLKVRGTLIAALAYFIVPLDIVPDFLAIIGLTDDIAVLTAALSMLSTHITPEHRAKARAAVEEARETEADGYDAAR